MLWLLEVLKQYLIAAGLFDSWLKSKSTTDYPVSVASRLTFVFFLSNLTAVMSNYPGNYSQPGYGRGGYAAGQTGMTHTNFFIFRCVNKLFIIQIVATFIRSSVLILLN